MELSPESEELLEEAMARLDVHNPDEAIKAALQSLLKDLVNQNIVRGIAQLDRGEGVSGEEARSGLQDRKVDWQKKNKS